MKKEEKMLKKNLRATRKKLEGWLEKAVESLKGEKGATAVEYALIIGLIAVAIIGSVTALGGKIKAVFENLVAALP